MTRRSSSFSTSEAEAAIGSGEPERRRSWLALAIALAALALLFAAVARSYVVRYSLEWRAVAGLYCAFLTLVALVIAPAFAAAREELARRFVDSPRQFALPLLWCTPYVLYAAGTGDFRWLACVRLLAIALVIPATYWLFRVRRAALFNWQDAVVAVLLVTVVLSHFAHGIWTNPANLDFMTRLFLVAIGVWTWQFIRPVPRLGYCAAFSWPLLKSALLNFAAFAAIAIPAGLLIGFTSWNPRFGGVEAFARDYLEIFLFIALLEELFFRGFLQNLLGSRFGAVQGQLFVSLLFGLFHILHAPFPNWRYVALASVAGWFYGSAYRATGSLLAPALVHAAVDTTWRTFFTRI